MSPFDSVVTKLSTESIQARKTIEDTIQLNSLEVIRMVKNRLRYGQGVNGGTIGKYQNLEYAQEKHAQNPLAGFGNVDLFLTGALSDDITVIKENNRFFILSTDEKYEMLANKYGADQFGLTIDQMAEFLYECYIFSLQTILNKVYG